MAAPRKPRRPHTTKASTDARKAAAAAIARAHKASHGSGVADRYKDKVKINADGELVIDDLSIDLVELAKELDPDGKLADEIGEIFLRELGEELIKGLKK